jgi:hypothetical protein
MSGCVSGVGWVVDTTGIKGGVDGLMVGVL